MTTNQTIDGVPRELIERIMHGCAFTLSRQQYEELRALLDAPACKTCGDSGWVPEPFSIRENVLECHDCKPAAQPQGEPVAWMYKRKDQSEYGKPSQHIAFASTDLEECRTGKNVEGRVIFAPRDDYFDWRPLYAEQPAPVAVSPTCCGSCPVGCVIK